MEGGSLFNSGFLGAGFNWWVGQIADDSTWRDNILPGKFESANQITGWGRRYKVRIIGLHDQGETEIASDQLPWAQLMYPVTAGGGQGASLTTANLRQGNMVFGFFLDGQDQQVPVIMGVLGNNAQTKLSTKIGDGRVTNTQPGSIATSGNAVSASGNTDTNRKVPDDDKVSTKPTPAGTPSASPKPGVVRDRFGRDPSRIQTRAERNAQQSARAEADRLGETGAVREARIANATVAATRQEASAAASPSVRAVPGATIENVDAVHLQSNADTKRLDLYLKKTVMLSPCDLPGSAMKAMQTDIDNLTKEVDKILQTAQSYVDAVSQIEGIGTPGEQIQKLIAKFVPKIAKYMKIVFNKILEFTTKQINKVLGPAADIMYPNQRFQFFDIKIEISEQIKCLFTKIMENLPKQIAGFLTDLLLLDGKNGKEPKSEPSKDPGPGPGEGEDEEDEENSPSPTQENSNSPTGTTPFVPICFVEELTGRLIKKNMGPMNKTSSEIVKSVGAFLNDIQEKQTFNIEQLIPPEVTDGTNVTSVDEDNGFTLTPLTELLGPLIEKLPAIPNLENLSVSIVSAFSFENISMNLFGCDLKPNCPVSDFYTLQEGAGAAEEAQLPRSAQVSKDALVPPRIKPIPPQPFATPLRRTLDLKQKIGKVYEENEFFPSTLYGESIEKAIADENDLTLF